MLLEREKRGRERKRGEIETTKVMEGRILQSSGNENQSQKLKIDERRSLGFQNIFTTILCLFNILPVPELG